MRDPSRVQAWGGGRINLLSGYVSHYRSPADFGENTTFFTGASLLLTRRICEQVGIFFEGFFMYCDDSDLCLRIRRAGYPLVVAETTAILHKEGASSPKRSPLIDEFATTSMLRLLLRHAKLPLLSQQIYLTLRLLNRASRGEWANLASVWRGAVTYVRQRHKVFADRL
jgi:GT2 family glycosyltransferase